MKIKDLRISLLYYMSVSDDLEIKMLKQHIKYFYFL